MGTISKVFTFKRKYLGFQEAIKLVNNIYTCLITGKDIKYYVSFSIFNNLNISKFKKEFNIRKVLIHFKNNIPLEFNNILTQTDVYEESFFYSHKETKGNRPFTGYSFNVFTEPEDFRFRICLPYLDGIEKSKKELIELTRYMVNKNFFFIVDRDIDKIMSDIIDCNTGLSCGSWSFKDRIEISAFGNFTPHDSRIPRPADVRFLFNEGHYNKHGGPINLLIKLHQELCLYFKNKGYHIQGRITSKNGLDLIKLLKKKSFFDTKIPLSVDLTKYRNTDLLTVFQMPGVSNRRIVLKDFTWKNTRKRYDYSRLVVWFNEDEGCNFELEIDKEIDEEDLISIEVELNEELEFSGYL